jgi:hypothetical protein
MLPLSRSHPPQSSAPQPRLLFGSGPPDRPGHSIWSTTLDDQSSIFPGLSSQPGQLHHSHFQQYPGLPQEQSQSIWSPSYHGSPTSLNAHAGEPSLTFAPQHSLVSGSHHQTTSSPIPVSHLFTNRDQVMHDQFDYSLMVPPHGQRVSQHPRHTDSMVPPTARMIYGQESYLDYHTNRMHGSRVGHGHPFPTPPLSQLWGNPG